MTLVPYTSTLTFTSDVYAFGASSSSADLSAVTLISYAAETPPVYTFSHKYTSTEATAAKVPTTGEENLRCYFTFSTSAIDPTSGIDDVTAYKLVTVAGATVYGTAAIAAGLFLQALY